MKTIWNYFNETIDYPSEIAHNPIPYGTIWHYVSSTFLDGFINYVKPVKVYQIDRYRSDDELCKYEDIEVTKSEMRRMILNNEIDLFHTNLSLFRDDIIILAKIETEDDFIDKTNRFIFFYFDYDVSDCSIGKFETNDTDEEVSESIKKYLNNSIQDKNIKGFTELPNSFLSGWISF